jgi:hypothetical protein
MINKDGSITLEFNDKYRVPHTYNTPINYHLFIKVLKLP